MRPPDGQTADRAVRRSRRGTGGRVALFEPKVHDPRQGHRAPERYRHRGIGTTMLSLRKFRK